MLDYVRQRPSPTISFSLLSLKFIYLIIIFFTFFNLFTFSLHDINIKSIDKPTLQTIFQLRNTQLINQQQTKKYFRIIYFREFDKTIDENRLKLDVKNITESYGIDLNIHILDQSKELLITKLCSLISEERRDTILIADLYTKEIDLISRTLKIPTIALTNRYQIVQGKLHNPYLFKLMPDPVEEAKTVAYTIDTRSVYTRIAVIYDVSLDMVEYRLAYYRVAKQHIIYQAQLPRVSLSYELRHAARTIMYDLVKLDVDLILCIMSTERELQFVYLIKEIGTSSIINILFNRTSWWFTSRLDEARNIRYFLKTYTASEDRRQTLIQSSITTMKIILNSVLRVYIRLSNIPALSSLLIGPTTCDIQLNSFQLRKTHTFIKLLTNYTEWTCDVLIGPGINTLLFDPKTLAWRVPTIFMVHNEPACQGLLTRIFYSTNVNADQFFRSCRTVSTSSRKITSAQILQNNATAIVPSNTLVDLTKFYQLIGRLWTDGTNQCHFVHINAPVQIPIIVGVVEQPYILISDDHISSEFHCTNGIPCYKIDPPSPNVTIDPFDTKTLSPPHCCYGISISLFLRIEDLNLIAGLKTAKLFVFSDKPNKWLALIQTLKNRRAHMSISAIPYESFLARSIDLTPPFYHSSYVILTAPGPTGPSLGAFLQPFSWTTWCMIFIVLNATALFETFFEWHSPYGLTPKGRRRQKVFSFASALTLSWSIIFSHTFKTKSPKCWSNRFLGNVWGGFGIVFIAIYTAKLAAFMVESAQGQTVDDVHGIIKECSKMSECSVGVVANTSDEEYLKRFYTNTLYTRIKYVPSYSQAIDLLRARLITHLLMDHSMARYYLTRDGLKSIRISGDNFGTFGLSLGFSKFDTDLKNNITNILLSYVEKGIIQRLHDEWYFYENCEFKQLNDNRKLHVDRFVGVFILLGSGMFVGLITLLLEWITFKYGVPYWRKRQWPGWMFCSQRLYAALNASDEVYDEAYRSSENHAFRSVGERLHNYSTRSDSLDLRVVDVPKLLCTTYQLKEQINKISEQQQQQQIPLLPPPNGDLIRESYNEQQTIRTRIHELEQELNRLRLQLSIADDT